MPLLFSPIYSPTHPWQLQSFFLFRIHVGRCHFLTLQWIVPHFIHRWKPSLSKHTGRGGATSTFSSWLVYLQFYEGVLLPHCPELRVPLFAMCLFFFFNCLFIIQFGFFLFFFSWVGGQSIQGAMLIWSRFFCGNTACRLAHLVVCFSQAG
jgi:hypothetical protein